MKKEDDALTPAEAVFGVMVWLSFHKPLTVGEGMSMAPLTAIAKEFCESHSLGDFDENSITKIKEGPKDVFDKRKRRKSNGIGCSGAEGTPSKCQ